MLCNSPDGQALVDCDARIAINSLTGGPQWYIVAQKTKIRGVRVMWFVIGLRRVFLGFWRLLIGLVIGVILYVYTFLYYDGLFTGVHDFTRDVVSWVKVQPSLAEYSKWNEILKIQDKLAFALYVLFGRFLWMVFESIFLTFPYWLIFGRSKEKKTVKSADYAQAGAPVQMGTAHLGAAAVGGSLSLGADDLEENAENLERSIDEALDRIKNVGA